VIEPVQNIEAERSLIASVLSRRIDLMDVGHVTALDFHKEGHRRIWKAMAWLDENGHPIGIVGVTTRLRKDGGIKEAGGAVEITKLAGEGVAKEEALHHADLVLDASRRRGVIAEAGTIIQAARSGDVAAAVEAGTATMMELQAPTHDGVFTAKESGQQVFASVEATREGGGLAHLGLKTGVGAYDRRCNHGIGVLPGNAMFLAARSGIGKTAFALELIAHAAVGIGTPPDMARTDYITLEMSHAELTMRALSRKSGIKLADIIRGELDDEALSELLEATVWWMKTGVRIVDKAGFTPQDLGAHIWKAARQGVQFFVVDHMHEMVRGPGQERLSDTEFYGRIAKMIKALAKRLQVRVLCLAQCNREAEGVKPQLSHLRGSGGIEEAADMVTFLHRDRAEPMTQVICAKNRNGMTGDDVMFFDGTIQKFRTPTHAEIQAMIDQKGGQAWPV
jgi:replicative DNA helicase